MSTYTRLFTVVVFAMVFTIVHTAQGEPKHLTLKYKGTSMKEVASEISRQLNCKVIMDEDLANTIVSGQFQDVSLDDFFARTFRGNNVIVMYDDIEQVVTVSSFGKKGRMLEFGQTVAAKSNVSSESGEIEVEPGVIFEGISISKKGPGKYEAEPGVVFQGVADTDFTKQPLQTDAGVVLNEITISQAAIDEPEVEPGVKLKKVVVAESESQKIEVMPGVEFMGVAGQY